MSNALTVIAQSTGVSQEEVTDVLRGMIVSAKNQHGASATNAELAIVSSVCAKYDLNPLVKEVAAFVSGGKLQMVVMIDGWYKIVNRQADFDGVEFDDTFDASGKMISTTCRMYLKSRSRPVSVTEYMAECRDPKSSVWAKWPSRMLRHKAYIQAARMAFSLSDIIDNDEADRIRSNTPERDITQKSQPIDLSVVNADFAECADLDTLREVAGRVRAVMEARGQWAEYRANIVALHAQHKARIEADYLASEQLESDAEYAESADYVVIDGESGEQQEANQRGE